MYIDSLIQMALQNTWQVPEVSQNGSADAGEGTTGPSFQELLAQSRDSRTETSRGQADAGKAEEAPQDKEESELPDQKKQDNTSSEVAMLDLSALFRPQILTQAEAVPAVQTAESGVEAVQVVTTTAATAPQSGESTPVVQTGAAAETEAPAVQTVQTPLTDTNTEPKTETAPEESSAVQALPTEETAVPQQTENNTSEEPSQDLTGNETGRSKTDTDTGNAVVEGMQMPLFREVENTPVRVGDTVVDMTAPDSEVENNLSSALKGAVEQGAQHVEIRLSPADLGTVVAEFTSSPEGALHVVLHAENEHTARLLSDHVSALSLLLQDGSHGEVRVEVAQPQSEQSAWQQPDQDGGQHQQQQQQPRRNTPPQETESFLHQLRLGLVQMEGENA